MLQWKADEIFFKFDYKNG